MKTGILILSLLICKVNAQPPGGSGSFVSNNTPRQQSEVIRVSRILSKSVVIRRVDRFSERNSRRSRITGKPTYSRQAHKAIEQQQSRTQGRHFWNSGFNK